MKKYLESLLNQNEKPLGTVLCIGAGSGGKLAEISSLGFNKIVAVEASMELHSALNRKSKKFGNVTTVNTWVLPPGQKTATVFLFNNPRYNSLSNTEDIGSTFPNVKLQKRMSVSGEPIDSFIEALQVEADTANALIILAPNAHHNLLLGAESSYLQQFDILVLAKDAGETKEITPSESSQLYSFDKAIFISNENISYEFFLRNPKTYKLQSQLKSLQSLEKINEDQLSQIDVLNKKVEQLQQAKNKADEEVTKLSNEITSIKEQVQAQSEESLLEHQKLKCTIESLESEIVELKFLNEKAATDLAGCTKERDAEQKWHKEHKSWAESLNSQQAQLKAELAEKNSSISLIQKMHAKAQIDLDNLREKYSEKLSSERELVELVKELREKLTIASKYYFKLQQAHPELLSSDTNGKES